MSAPLNPLTIIPARRRATRLPDKPLLPIAGIPMIVHVYRRALAAGLGPVVVACAEPEIAEIIERAGGRAVLTRPDHPSGSDRIHEAVTRIDPSRAHDAVINVQGDWVNFERADLECALELLDDEEVAIGTLAATITDAAERNDPNVVKAVVSLKSGERRGRALYFTRATAPSGEGPLLHHIGLYVFRRAALERFTRLPPSPLEVRERLEQLRALEAGMRIDVALIDTPPLEVNTPADFAKWRALIARGA